MQPGIIGRGRMGASLARRLAHAERVLLALRRQSGGLDESVPGGG